MYCNDPLTHTCYHQQSKLPDAVAGRYLNDQFKALRQALAASAPGLPSGDKPSR